jgi:hypothetical protein
MLSGLSFSSYLNTKATLNLVRTLLVLCLLLSLTSLLQSALLDLLLWGRALFNHSLLVHRPFLFIILTKRLTCVSLTKGDVLKPSSASFHVSLCVDGGRILAVGGLR